MEILHSVLNVLYKAMSYLPYLAGGATLLYVVLAILAFFAFPFAVAALEIIKPWLVLASDIAVGFLRTLWSGFIDMMDDWRSIAFVITLATLTGYFGWQSKECPVYTPAQIAAQRAPMKPGVVKRFTTNVKKAFTPAPLPAKKQVAPSAEPDTGLVKPFWESGE